MCIFDKLQQISFKIIFDDTILLYMLQLRLAIGFCSKQVMLSALLIFSLQLVKYAVTFDFYGLEARCLNRLRSK